MCELDKLFLVVLRSRGACAIVHCGWVGMLGGDTTPRPHPPPYARTGRGILLSKVVRVYAPCLTSPPTPPSLAPSLPPSLAPTCRFDAAWAKNVTAIATKQCAPRASNPDLLGYFADNELDWSGRDLHKDSNSILDWYLLRPSATPGPSSGRAPQHPFQRLALC